MPGHLVAVLHSPPLGSGIRTLRRVDIAREALGCAKVSVANLYAFPLSNANRLASEGMSEGWEQARDDIRRALMVTDTSDVLLAYGIQSPSGTQRDLHRAQLAWLEGELSRYDLRVWTFGGSPYHPSRWHRLTHRQEQGSSVRELASSLLTPSPLKSRPGVDGSD